MSYDIKSSKNYDSGIFHPKLLAQPQKTIPSSSTLLCYAVNLQFFQWTWLLIFNLPTPTPRAFTRKAAAKLKQLQQSTKQKIKKFLDGWSFQFLTSWEVNIINMLAIKKGNANLQPLFHNTQNCLFQVQKSSYNVRNNPTKWEGKFNTKVRDKSKKSK